MRRPFSFSLPLGLILLLCLSTSFLKAQANLTDNLPMDTAIRKGVLPNGLTWYVRYNAMPKNVVELRLVVNAGSLQEADDQQGLAHFTEHMAFNGTRSFKKNEIVSFLQEIGVGFGNDLNAYTSFEETVYQLPIPTTKAGNLEKGFQVMEEWASAITFLDKDIDNERGVILEESRLGKGAEDRMYQKLYPLLFAGSKYAARLPIGKDSILRSFKPEALRRFYAQWYRPDLMAVVVVGDVPPAQAEALIQKHFGHLRNPDDAPKRLEEPLPPYSTTRAIVLSDAEATQGMVSVTWSAFAHPEPTRVGEYRRDIVRNLFASMANQRLREPAEKENPPYLGAFMSLGASARNYQQLSLNVFNGDRPADSALAAALLILKQIKQFGFTQAELDRTAKSLLANVERANREKDKSPSVDYAEEYIRNFLTNEPLPGITRETEYHRQFLPGISLAEVNAVNAGLIPNPHFLVAYTGPEVFATSLPDTLALLQAIRSVQDDMAVTAYEEDSASTQLMTTLPTPGKIIRETYDTEMGARTWWLQNGTRVTVKKTDFKNDQVMLGGRRPGGIGQYPASDKFNTRFAVPLINSMGFGEFSPQQMRKVMAGKMASVSASLSEAMDQWGGSSSAGDVETLLQLLYLQATQPRQDYALFQSFMTRARAQTANALQDPETVFVDSITTILYGHHPMKPVLVPKPEEYDQVSMKRVLDIYRERMGDATGMHFVLVGTLDEATLKPLVERYIGALPASGKQPAFRDNGLRPAKGKLDLTMYQGREDKCLLLKIYNGEMAYSDRRALQAEAIGTLLTMRVVDNLREKIQGVYSGNVDGGFSRLPYPHYNFVIQLPTGSEKIDTVRKAMEAEIALLKKAGPDPKDLDKMKKQWVEDHREGLQQNGSWLRQLLEMSFPGDKASNFLQYEKIVNSLTTTEIRDAAKLFLQDNYVLTAILKPAKN